MKSSCASSITGCPKNNSSNEPFLYTLQQECASPVVEKQSGSEGYEDPEVTQRTLAGCDAAPVPAGVTLCQPTV